VHLLFDTEKQDQSIGKPVYAGRVEIPLSFSNC